DSRDGLDQSRLSQFLPESSYVHVESAGVAIIGQPPHAVQQRFTCHHTAMIARQLLQQGELLARQPDIAPLATDVESGWVYHQNAIVVDRAARLDTIHPAQDGVDPSNQFSHAERLGDVVVSAKVQTQDLVGLSGPR